MIVRKNLFLQKNNQIRFASVIRKVKIYESKIAYGHYYLTEKKMHRLQLLR